MLVFFRTRPAKSLIYEKSSPTLESDLKDCIFSRPWEVFLGKGALKICSKFTGEHPSWNAISIKLRLIHPMKQISSFPEKKQAVEAKFLAKLQASNCKKDQKSYDCHMYCCPPGHMT